MIGDVILNVLHWVTSLCRNHDVIWSLRYDHIWLLTQPPPPTYNATYIYYYHTSVCISSVELIFVGVL